MTRGWLAVAVLVAGAGIAAGQEITQRGATPPQVITVVKAVYTKEARAAKIEGTVVLEATVLTDGTVADNVKVVRSLDTKFGLDEEAIKATKQWKFKPATKDGKPVPCPVAIEQSFFLNSTK
jgi:periplasmic protein TonB